MKTRYLIALALGAGAAAGTAMGCELISSVDRSKIAATGSGGSAGGGGEGGAGGATTGGGMGGMAMGGGGQGGMGGFPDECSNGMQDGMETGVECGGGTCPGCANGITCNAGTDCSSTFCADGVCCDAACDGECQACAMAGMEGTCTAHPQGSDPENDCDMQTADTCGTTGMCDGNGACELHPAGTACGDMQSCTGDTQTNADACDGMGMCEDAGTTMCAPYVWGAMGCLTSCTMSNQCSTDNYCDTATNQCVPKLANGQDCTGNGNQCQSGHCVDGVCCNTGCSVGCQSCNIIGLVGTCSTLPQGTVDPICAAPNTTCDSMGLCKLPAGASCMMDTECASGMCTGTPVPICTTP